MSKKQYIDIGEKVHFDVDMKSTNGKNKTTISGRITSVGEGGFWFELIGQKHIKFNNDNIGDDFEYAGEKFKWARIVKGRRVFMEWVAPEINDAGKSNVKNSKEITK